MSLRRKLYQNIRIDIPSTSSYILSGRSSAGTSCTVTIYDRLNTKFSDLDLWVYAGKPQKHNAINKLDRP